MGDYGRNEHCINDMNQAENSLWLTLQELVDNDVAAIAHIWINC
jgi:hypothetical protein